MDESNNKYGGQLRIYAKAVSIKFYIFKQLVEVISNFHSWLFIIYRHILSVTRIHSGGESYAVRIHEQQWLLTNLRKRRLEPTSLRIWAIYQVALRFVTISDVSVKQTYCNTDMRY